MRFLLSLLLLCYALNSFANDIESMSIENRIIKSDKFWDVSKLDLSIFSSTSTIRHWQTKRISTYNFDNSLFVGYAFTKSLYVDMKGKISTYKNFGEAAAYGDHGDTNFTELILKMSWRDIVPQNKYKIYVSATLEEGFFTYKNAHIYSNQNSYTQLTFSFRHTWANTSLYVKPYFRKYDIHGSLDSLGNPINTIKQSTGIMFSEYVNLTKNFYLYAGQSIDRFYGHAREDKDSLTLSFGIGGNIHPKVGYYAGASWFNVLRSGDDRFFGEDFYKYPAYSLDLYFFIF